MKKLALLATYWNEEEWIEASLKQIEAISPDFCVICDGCFDDKQNNNSSDGTSEKLAIFCERNGFSLLKAYRGSRYTSFLKLLKFGFKKKFSLAYFYWIVRHFVRTDKYRLNQAVTFNMMLELSINNIGSENLWFMTYDADQFYSDDLLENMKERIAEAEQKECSLLSAQEYTFSTDFKHFNDKYEKRTWNNMPHKYYPNTIILPTRDIKLIRSFSLKYYLQALQDEHVGIYYHYKFRINKARLAASYTLGDRKKPSLKRTMSTNVFDGEHPKIIRNKING